MSNSAFGQRFKRMNPSQTRSKRRQIQGRDGSCCHYCKRQLLEQQITLDHKHPLSLGGSNALDNLVIACRDCNREKGNMPYDIFVEEKKKKRKKFPH